MNEENIGMSIHWNERRKAEDNIYQQVKKQKADHINDGEEIILSSGEDE